MSKLAGTARGLALLYRRNIVGVYLPKKEEGILSEAAGGKYLAGLFEPYMKVSVNGIERAT